MNLLKTILLKIDLLKIICVITKMDDYIKYNNSGISELNKTKTWRDCPIDTTYTDRNKFNDKTNGTSYVLHATGDCDMNGRKYIALPAYLNVNDPAVKAKYNIM